MKIFILIKKFSDSMIKLSAYIGALALAIMSIAITYEVIFRYFFNSPTIWSSEVSRYCSVYILFMGLSYTLREKAHINIEIVTKYIPTKPRIFIKILTDCIGMALALLIIIEGWKMFYEAYDLSLKSMEVIRTPLAIPYFCIPWGGFWLAVQYMIQLSSNFQSLIRGET